MIIPEKQLWQSVLITAIKDAFISNTKNTNKYTLLIAEEARDWLLHNNSNYIRVCNMADVDPTSLRTKIKEVFVHNRLESDIISNDVVGEAINIFE